MDNQFQDKTLTCKDCGQPFTFTASEQQFYKEKGFNNEPSRCPEHRAAYKKQRREQGFGGRGPRQMYDVVCSNCGNPAQVPFQPRGDRPVLCNDCFSKQREERGGYRRAA